MCYVRCPVVPTNDLALWCFPKSNLGCQRYLVSIKFQTKLFTRQLMLGSQRYVVYTNSDEFWRSRNRVLGSERYSVITYFMKTEYLWMWFGSVVISKWRKYRYTYSQQCVSAWPQSQMERIWIFFKWGWVKRLSKPSTARHSHIWPEVKPGTNRHSQAQPGTARHSQAQPSTGKVSQAQTGTARLRHAQQGAARHSQAQPGTARTS